MLKRFSKSRTRRVVELCERCGSVCDTACRVEADREAVRRQMLFNGWRLIKCVNRK